MLILNSNVNVLYCPQINTTYVLYKITLMFTSTNSEYTMSKNILHFECTSSAQM